jgi:hypothetical protein
MPGIARIEIIADGYPPYVQELSLPFGPNRIFTQAISCITVGRAVSMEDPRYVVALESKCATPVLPEPGTTEFH